VTFSASGAGAGGAGGAGGAKSRSSESTTSSRDCSPSRSSPFGVNVRSPVVLRRGPRGYGFSLTAIRVFYGDSGYFTLHHMISVRTSLVVSVRTSSSFTRHINVSTHHTGLDSTTCLLSLRASDTVAGSKSINQKIF